ncbi:MAG: arylsulfatase [Planctomycetota bacterium]|jgi:arylsulfatase
MRGLIYVLSLSVFIMVSAAKAESTPPNILLIVVDDMGYSDIGCFGGEIRTPNIDGLAKSGVRLTNFYAAPTCSPTRSMLMSGTDHHLAGLGTMNEALAPNQRGKPGYEGFLNDRVVSFASLLRDGGYHTYMAGKWHLGEKPVHDPFRRGFEKSYTMLIGGASHFDDEWMMSANYTPIYAENGRRVHVPRGFYSSEFYTDRIIEWTGKQEDSRPFFAYLSFTAPHDPLHVPDDWLDKYKGAYDHGYDVQGARRLQQLKSLGLVSKDVRAYPRHPMIPAWDSLPTEEKKRQARKMEIYAAMVENVDFHVGRVFAHLKKIGKYDNTLVIFFSDNGANGAAMHQYPETNEAWVERNSDNRFENYGRRGSRIAMGPGWAQASMSPFRFFKGFIAEGGIRSPLIVSGPGVARAGEHSAAVVHVMDVAPTLLEIAGIDHPKVYRGRDILPIQGKSMAGFLRGKSESVRGPEEPLGWEFISWRAMRLGKWKVTWISRPFGQSDWELFDLEADPGETRDLSGEHPAKLQELVRLWKKYRDENGLVMLEKPLQFER